MHYIQQYVVFNDQDIIYNVGWLKCIVYYTMAKMNWILYNDKFWAYKDQDGHDYVHNPQLHNPQLENPMVCVILPSHKLLVEWMLVLDCVFQLFKWNSFSCSTSAHCWELSRCSLTLILWWLLSTTSSNLHSLQVPSCLQSFVAQLVQTKHHPPKTPLLLVITFSTIYASSYTSYRLCT